MAATSDDLHYSMERVFQGTQGAVASERYRDWFTDWQTKIGWSAAGASGLVFGAGGKIRQGYGISVFYVASCVETRPIGCMKWTGEYADTTFDDWITLQRKNNLCPSACREDKCAPADP